jgi:hypothetical protein
MPSVEASNGADGVPTSPCLTQVQCEYSRPHASQHNVTFNVRLSSNGV